MKNSGLEKNIAIIKKKYPLLKKIYHVDRVGIFGSTVRGEQTRKSDIDILVEFSQPISFLKFIELETFLSKALKKKVDLVSKKALKSIIKRQILRETIYA